MALVSDLSHSESIVLLKALLTDSVHGKSLLVELFQRRLLPASFVHHFLTITTGRYSFVIAFVAIFSITSVARTVSFFETCSEFDMTTPFFALLSGVAASVSATSSATLTCAFLLRCPVQDLVF